MLSIYNQWKIAMREERASLNQVKRHRAGRSLVLVALRGGKERKLHGELFHEAYIL